MNDYTCAAGALRQHILLIACAQRRRLPRIAQLLFVLLLLAFIPPAATLYAQSEPSSPAEAFDLTDVPAALRVSDGTYYRPGEVLVGLQGPAAGVQALLQTPDISASAPLDIRGSERLHAGFRANGSPQGFVLTVPVGREWETIVRLQRDPNVLFAHPNWVIEAAQGAAPETAFVVNDPLYRNEQWYAQRIQASRAWPVVEEYADETSVRVAVIDSGVDTTHPDLGGRVLPVKSYLVDIFGDPIEVDDFGHGTHIAGLIGATVNNGTGIAGMAPNVLIDPYKVLDNQGEGSILNAAAAIRLAAENGADIINMSFQIRASFINDPGNVELDSTLHTAIYFAVDQGALLVAATGNRHPEPVAFPAAYPEVMAVASTDYDNAWASYSATGSEVDLAAPGGTSRQPLASAWPIGLFCNATVEGGQGYCSRFGTSFSTGLVSGVAALLLQMDPDLSADQLRTLLTDSANPIDAAADEAGAGLLNATEAVRSLLPAAADVVSGDIGIVARPRTGPQQRTVAIRNESATPISWTLTRPGNASWLVFSDFPNPTRSVTGISAYDQLGQVRLTLSPGALPPGVYTARMELTTGTGETAQTSAFDVSMAILEGSGRRYLPFAAVVGSPLEPQGAGLPRWETPDADEPTNIALSGDQSVEFALPFSFPLGGRSYRNVRIHANGLLTFPAEETGGTPAGSCPAATAWPHQAVYGWWADLAPEAEDATIRTFRTATGRFIVEFTDVPLANGGPDDIATFQMALDADGTISLNYRQTPANGRATIGVEALDGRLANLIHCAAGGRIVGLPPVGEQSFVITPEEIF